MANLTSIGTILLNDPTFVKNLNKALVQTNANFQRLGTVGLFSGEDGQDASFMKYNLDAIFLPIFIKTLPSDLGWDQDICGDTKNAEIFKQLAKKFGEDNLASLVPMSNDISEDITSRYDQAYKDMVEWCKTYGKPSEYIDKCQEIIEAIDTAIRNKYNTLNVLGDVTYNDTKDSSITYKALWVNDWYNATKIDDCSTIYRTHVKDYPLGSIQVIENESGEIIGSLPYSFIDPRFNNAHVSQIAAELKSKINATSLITLHQENDNLIGKILDIIPKIYCDPIDGKWKWSINGENTGIPAQGVDGKAGQNGSILILQRLENGITITKDNKDIFIPIIPNSYEGNVEPKDATTLKFKWMDPLVDDNAMVNRIVHTTTISIIKDEHGNITGGSIGEEIPTKDPNNSKIKTLVDYIGDTIPKETVQAIRYALWDNVNRTDNYDTNYTGRFRIWKRLTDDSCLYVAGDKDGTFNENSTDAYSSETGYKYGYKIKEGTTDPGQAEITNMDGQACIVFPGAPYDSGEVTGEMRSSFWFGTVHIQRAYPKDKDATCNIATVICDNTNMVRCDLDQNTFAGDMMRLDPYVTEEPDRYGGAQHYPRGLMLPIGSPFMTNDNLSALSKDFSSHILYSDQGGFETLTMRSGSIWRGSFDKESIGDWKPLGDIQGYKKSDKNILHIGSVQDYRGLDYVSTDNIAVPGRMEGSANNNQIISDENNENTYNVRSDHNFQSRVNIDEPTVITSYRDTHNPIYGDKEYPALLTTEGDVVIGAYKHVNNKEYFWKKNDNGDTLDYAATNPFIPQYENGKQTGTYQPVTGDYANPNPDSHRTDDVVNIIDKDAKGDTTKGTMGQGGLWIQGSITKALADRMRVDFFEKSPLRSVIGTTFDIVPQAITRFDTPDVGMAFTVDSIPTGKLPADMVGFSSNVRFSLYADHAIGAQDLIAERSMAVYRQGTYKKINPDKISTKPGDFSFVDKTTYPTFYVGQAGVVVNAEDIYFANSTCIDFSDWHYYKAVKNEKGETKGVYDVPWEINTPGGNNAVPRMVFGWGIVYLSPLHTLEKMRANQDDVAPSTYSVTKGWNPEGIAINDNVTMADGAFSIRHPKVSNLYTPDKNIANRVTFFQGPVDYGENVYGVVSDNKLDSQLKNNRNFNGAMRCITDVYNYNSFTTNHLDFGLTAMWPTADFVVWDQNPTMYPDVNNRHFESSQAKDYALRASGIFHSGLLVDGHLYDQDMSPKHYWLGKPYDFAFIVAGNSQLVGDVDVKKTLSAKNIAKYSKTLDEKGTPRYDNSILLGGGLATVSGPKWEIIDDKYVYKKRKITDDEPDTYIDPTSTDLSKSSDSETQTPIMIDLGDSFGKKRLMRFNLAKNVKIEDNGDLSMETINDADGDDQAVLLGRWPGSSWKETSGMQSMVSFGDYLDKNSNWRPSCPSCEYKKDDGKSSYFKPLNPTIMVASMNDSEVVIRGAIIVDSFTRTYSHHGGLSGHSSWWTYMGIKLCGDENSECLQDKDHLSIGLNNYLNDVTLVNIPTKVSIPKGVPKPPKGFMQKQMLSLGDNSGPISTISLRSDGKIWIDEAQPSNMTLHPIQKWVGGCMWNIGNKILNVPMGIQTPNLVGSYYRYTPKLTADTSSPDETQSADITKNVKSLISEYLTKGNADDVIANYFSFKGNVNEEWKTLGTRNVDRKEYAFLDRHKGNSTANQLESFARYIKELSAQYWQLSTYIIQNRSNFSDPDTCLTELYNIMMEDNRLPKVTFTFSYPITGTDIIKDDYKPSEGPSSPGGGGGTTPTKMTYYIFGTIDGSYIQNGAIRNPQENDLFNVTIPNNIITIDGVSYSSILSSGKVDKVLDAITNDNFKNIHQYIVVTTVDAENEPNLQSLTFGVTSGKDDNNETIYSWDTSTSVGGLDIPFPSLIQTVDTSDYVVMHPDPNRSIQEVKGTLKAEAFYETSDRRLKDNIEDIDTTTKRKLSNIDFKQFDIDGHHKYGVIAQDIEKQIPAVVSTDKQGYKSVDYISLLCAKISELQDRIEELEKKERKKES